MIKVTLLPSTPSMTKMTMIRMIHSLMFCHHSFLFNLTAERWKLLASWDKFSVMGRNNACFPQHKKPHNIWVQYRIIASCKDWFEVKYSFPANISVQTQVHVTVRTHPEHNKQYCQAENLHNPCQCMPSSGSHLPSPPGPPASLHAVPPSLCSVSSHLSPVHKTQRAVTTNLQIMSTQNLNYKFMSNNCIYTHRCTCKVWVWSVWVRSIKICSDDLIRSTQLHHVMTS